MDLSDVSVWDRKTFDRIVEKLEFVNLELDDGLSRRLAQIAKFEFDTGEREAQIDILLYEGYFEVSCWFAGDPEQAWFIGFSQTDVLSGPNWSM